MGIINWLRDKGVTRTLKEFWSRPVTKTWFLVLFWNNRQRKRVLLTADPIRYGTVDLALSQIEKEQIPGSFAEGGVFQGAMSKFIHARAPERILFLFDTFQGFDSRDSNTHLDDRFRNTSEEFVRHTIGDTQNIVFRKGFFPETARGLEDEVFAFVMIDFDKYEPTKAALEFFYPRTNRGGFIFIHDYSNPESDWACSKVLDKFLSDKPEKPILIPDAWGSALFRKM